MTILIGCISMYQILLLIKKNTVCKKYERRLKNLKKDFTNFFNIKIEFLCD